MNKKGAFKKEYLEMVQDFMHSRTDFRITREQLWMLTIVIFASLYTLAFKHGKVTLATLASFYVQNLKSGRRKIKCKASSTVNNEMLNEDPDFFNTLILQSKESDFEID